MASTMYLGPQTVFKLLLQSIGFCWPRALNEMRTEFSVLHPCSHSGRFILHAKKTAFIVEHDFIMATCTDVVFFSVFLGSKAICANQVLG